MNNNIPRGYSQNQMMMSRNNQHNFNAGFQPSQNLIPAQDWNNNGNLIHNNVASNVFNETNLDNMLHIDSFDRDTTAFPNPFKFTVSLGGSGTSSEKVYDRDTQTYKIVNYSGVPEPRIQKNFINVKQVILDKVFFPQYITYTRTLVGDTFVYTGLTTISAKYRYLILKIKELDNNRVYSTNNRVGDDSFILYKDKDLGGSGTEIWLSSFCKRTFLKSALKNLDKLSVEIVSPEGEIVKIKYVIAGGDNTEYDMPLSELTGPNQENYEYAIQMIVTTVENDLSTNVNYR
jgi:hypothetical protein